MSLRWAAPLAWGGEEWDGVQLWQGCGVSPMAPPGLSSPRGCCPQSRAQGSTWRPAGGDATSGLMAEAAASSPRGASCLSETGREEAPSLAVVLQWIH